MGNELPHDDYVAMQWGPVPSKTKELMDGYSAEQLQQAYFDHFIVLEDRSVKLRGNAPELVFSPAEMDALLAVLAVWKQHPTAEKLVNYTHMFPEWSACKNRVQQGKVPLMPYAAFFGEGIADNYCPADAARVRTVQKRWKRHRQTVRMLDSDKFQAILLCGVEE